MEAGQVPLQQEVEVVEAVVAESQTEAVKVVAGVAEAAGRHSQQPAMI